MTSLQVSVLSCLAAVLICWIQLAHASSLDKFTSNDSNFIFPQTGMNSNLLPPEGNKAVAQLYAVGYQHYIYNGTSWAVKSATAKLYNSLMEEVGIHFYLPQKDSGGGQPSWLTEQDFSLVTGKLHFSQPVENTIPWVLLQATHSEGDTDLFGKVTYIQRLYTEKGLAPVDPGQTINATCNSPYTAFYVYYKKL